jgi:hypothetical protein
MLKFPSAIGAVMVGKVNYDGRQFAVYAKGRAMSPAMRDRWMTVFASHVPPVTEPRRILVDWEYGASGLGWCSAREEHEAPYQRWSYWATADPAIRRDHRPRRHSPVHHQLRG